VTGITTALLEFGTGAWKSQCRQRVGGAARRRVGALLDV